MKHSVGYRTGRFALPLLLAFAMTGTMVSCNTNKTETTADTTAAEASGEQTTVETELEPDFEDVNYEGRSFIIWVNDQHSAEIIVDADTTGSLANDVIYKRNRYVEEKYNVTIEALIAQSSAPESGYPDLAKNIMAGDDFCQLIDSYAYKVHQLIIKDYLKNWYDITGVNLTNPWWNTVSNNESSFNNKLYMANGSLNLSGLTDSWCMFYNVALTDNLGIGVKNLQNTVLDGRWTLDLLEQNVKNCYEDLNGDGSHDIDDRYGLMTFWSTVDPTFAVFGESMTGRDEEGNLKLTYMNEKTVDMFGRMYDLIFNNEDTFAAPEDYGITRSQFVEGHSVFIPGLLMFAYSMTDMKDDYGIIPYPKWDESQELYYTCASDGASLIGIPVTADTSDSFIGNITEALNYYSWRDVYPVNLDVLLKGRYSLDSNTADIIDLFIFNNKYEFATQFSESGGAMLYRLKYFMRDLIQKKSPDIASAYQKVESKISVGIESIMEHYR